MVGVNLVYFRTNMHCVYTVWLCPLERTYLLFPSPNCC